MPDSMNLSLLNIGLGGDSGLVGFNKINTNYSLLAEHDHSTGKGVKVKSAGLSIDANLTFNSYAATSLKNAQFVNQPATVTDKNATYVKSGELYFVDAAGNQIAITNGGAIAGAPGSISSLTAPASAFFGAGAFTFEYDTGKKATINGGEYHIFDGTTSTSYIALKSPGSVTTYSQTLPAAVPGFVDAFAATDTAGVQTWKRGTPRETSVTANAITYWTGSSTLGTLTALTNGQIYIGSTGVAPVGASLLGTTNQLTVTGGAGSITLSLPQNIHATATPSFAGITLSGALSGTSASLSSTLAVTGTATISGTVNIATLTASRVVITDGSKNLTSLDYSSANTASALVQRDASGNFNASNITLSSSLSAATLSVSGTSTHVGVASFSSDLAITGYVRNADWSSSAGVRVKKITGTLPATAGTHNYAHGLSDKNRIIHMFAIVDEGVGSLRLINIGRDGAAGSLANLEFYNDTNISVYRNLGSTSLPITIYVTYTN